MVKGSEVVWQEVQVSEGFQNEDRRILQVVELCERCPAGVEKVWGSRSALNVIRLGSGISHVTYR
jgi:hypothetical protein